MRFMTKLQIYSYTITMLVMVKYYVDMFYGIQYKGYGITEV